MDVLLNLLYYVALFLIPFALYSVFFKKKTHKNGKIN